VSEGKGDDALLEVGAELVGHPRSPALAHLQGFQAPAVDLALPAIVGRAIDPHRPAGGRDVAQLLGEGEQPQAESDEHVMLCHRLFSFLVSQPGD